MKKLFFSISLLLFVGVSMSDAFAQKKLTQTEIDSYGTKIFDEDKEKVFNAVRDVLLSQNYEFELENFEKGLIKTKRKIIGQTGVATSMTSAQYQLNYRQYYVYITETLEGKTKVVFSPKIYIGEADVTDRKVWVLKGAGGEYKLWENLFKNIEERL
jgi:hypothetical protein